MYFVCKFTQVSFKKLTNLCYYLHIEYTTERLIRQYCSLEMEFFLYSLLIVIKSYQRIFIKAHVVTNMQTFCLSVEETFILYFNIDRVDRHRRILIL